MRVERDIAIDAPPRADLGAASRTRTTTTRFWHGHHAGSSAEEQAGAGSGARFTMRMRVGSADVGGLVEVVECDEPRDMAWTSITGHRPPRALAAARDRRRRARRSRCGCRWDSPGRPARQRGGPARGADGRDDARGNPEESGARAGRRGGQEEVADEDGKSLPGTGALRARQREGADRGGRDPADAAGPAVGRRCARSQTLGPQPRGGRDLARRALPRRDDDRRRARARSPSARSTRAPTRSPTRCPTRASSRATASGVMCRNHRGFIEATIALSKLGADALYLNTAFAGPQLAEVVRAREAEGADLRRGVQRAARGRRPPAQALRGLARLATRCDDPTLDELIAERRPERPSCRRTARAAP